MFDAVDLVAKQPHVDAVKDFAVKIMTAIGADAEGAAGTAHETFNTIVVTLSPVAKDYTKANNQFIVEMAKQLAWIRSKNATEMIPLLNERMSEFVARGVPGTPPPLATTWRRQHVHVGARMRWRRRRMQ